jgi:tetratricopeptide (TPR) repeat protein
LGNAYGAQEELLPKAKAYALKAMEIDSALAEAHSALAGVKSYEWDWPGVEKEYQLAIELNPGYATAYQRYSYLLMRMGRFEESFAKIEKALALDPVSISINSSLGDRLYFAGRYDQATEQFRKTLEMDPNFLRAHLLLGSVYTHTGKYAEAMANLTRRRTFQGTARWLRSVTLTPFRAPETRRGNRWLNYRRCRSDAMSRRSMSPPYTPG